MKIKCLSLAIALTLFVSTTSASGLGGLGKLLDGNALGDIASSIVGTKSPSVAEIAGTWKSAGPAVNFKSKDILKSAGGAVAASTIKSQLAPYYKKAHLENLTITIGADSKFSIKAPVGNITGTLVKNSDDSFTMKFNVFNKINIGSMKAHIQHHGNSLDLTFDIAKLVDLVSKLASKVDVKQVESITNLLSSYDGVYAGFEFHKTN